MEPEKRKSCHLYLVKEGDWLARNLYCLYISIDKFWCDADSVKQQLLAAGRSTIRFSTKVTSNSTRHWWRMTQRKTLYNEHDLSNSPCVQRKESSSPSSTFMYFAPPFYPPRHPTHTLRYKKDCDGLDQTHLFRNPLIFCRTKPESAEGRPSPGVQWSRIWEQNDSQTSRKRNRCCSTHSHQSFRLLN